MCGTNLRVRESNTEGQMREDMQASLGERVHMRNAPARARKRCVEGNGECFSFGPGWHGLNDGGVHPFSNAFSLGLVAIF